MTTSPPRAWAEIDLSALQHNLRTIQRVSQKEVMAIVKAGAYGHGLIKIARELDKFSLPFLGVANAGEARLLHEAGIQTRPYILGATLPQEREEIAARDWTPCLCSLEELKHFDALGQDSPIQAHLALDTGMGRGGFLPHQFHDILGVLKNSKGIQLTGIGSHLPVADEDQSFTRAQFEIFDSLIESLPTQRADFHIHLSNSAGLLGYRSRTTNLVRPGLSLYGISPLSEEQHLFRPVMSLKTRVSLIHHLPQGHGVSYGRTILQRDTRAAILAIGYGDGYPRSLSDRSTEVIIRDIRCPLLGRITMDQIIVDVTDLPECREGDVATLFGPELSVTELSQKAGTIPWEILTQITPRVDRLYF